MRLFWISASIVFLLDRITKYLLLKFNYEKIVILPVLNIIKVWNKGIAFGLFSKGGNIANLILILITIIVLGVSYIWAKKIYSKEKKDKITLFSLGMLFGGGLGNLTDRILFGKVFDFIDLHIKSFHWATFNVADISITFSLFLLIYKNLNH